MTTHEGRPHLMRPDGERRSEVAPIELFFDLVYVFAIIQLSHTLLEHLTLLGAVQTALRLAAVWWVWNYTAWAMNWLDPRRTSVRILNALLMLVALGMALALPKAFDDAGGAALVFALCYAAAQIGRPAFVVVALRGTVVSRNYRNILAWSTVASTLVVVGAFLPPTARLVVWAVGIAVDRSCSSVAGTAWKCRLASIIAPRIASARCTGSAMWVGRAATITETWLPSSPRWSLARTDTGTAATSGVVCGGMSPAWTTRSAMCWPWAIGARTGPW